MRQVQKFDLSNSINFSVRMPVGAQILSVGRYMSYLCLWALVDSDAPKELRFFDAYPTGYSIPGDAPLHYLGTVQTEDVLSTWHIFERTEVHRA